MSWIDRLEKKCGQVYIPHLPLFIVVAQLLVFFVSAGDPSRIVRLALIPHLVGEGEVWRLFSFLFMPPGGSLGWMAIMLIIFYQFATALEDGMGAFRFNLLYFGTAGGYVVATGLYLLFPGLLPEGRALLGDVQLSNHYIFIIIILGYAVVYPRTIINLFFVLPIEARWIGVLDALLLLHGLLFQPVYEKVLIICVTATFLAFYGPMLAQSLKARARRKAFERETAVGHTLFDEDDDEEED